MSDFPTRPIGNLVVDFDRKRIPITKSDRRPGPYPYYGATGAVDSVDNFLFDGLYLLVAEDGENLRSRTNPIAFLADGKFWVNNHAHVLQANAEGDTRFLAYAIEDTDISGYVTGSAQPKLNRSNLFDIRVPAPPLDVQLTIARFLGGLDEKIDLNIRAATTSLDLLDQVSRRACADIPLAPLRCLTTLNRATVKPSSYGGQLVNHYSLPAYDAGARAERVAASSIRSGKNLINGPSILVSRLNPRFNRTWWVIPPTDRPALASPEFAMLQADDRRKLAGVWLAVRDESFRDELVSRVTGTSGSHQRIRPNDLMSIDVPDVRQIPDELLDTVLLLLDYVEHLRKEIDALAELRDALLPELLSGRLRVPAASTA